MIKRILVDLSDTRRGQAIVRHATELACSHQAEITASLERAEDRPQPVGRLQGIAAAGWARELHRQSVIDAQETIVAVVDELRTCCTSKGIPFRIVERGSESFRSTVDEFQFYDLFICGTNLSFEDTSLESGSEELIQLVEEGVRPILAVCDEYRPVKRVLVALSEHGDSARTLKQFLQLRLCPQAEMEIVAFNGHGGDRPHKLLSESARYCRRYGVEPQQQVLEGPMSVEVLPHAVDADADMIVLGNSDHSRLARWFFGGAVMEIIRESDRSLFLSQ